MATNLVVPTVREKGGKQGRRLLPAPVGPWLVPEPQTPRPKRGPVWPLVLLGVALGAGAYYWSIAASRGPSKASGPASFPAIVVVEGPFVQTVRLTGTVAAQDFAAIRAPRLQVRAQLTLTGLAAAGSTVKAGDVVARFESRELEDRVDDLKSSQVQAEAKLEGERAAILVERETLRQERDAAKAEYEKAAFDLRKAEVLSDIQAEILRNAAAEAKAVWQQLEREVSLSEEAFQRRLAVEQISVTEAELNYKRYARDLDQMALRSPVGGLVVLEPMFKGGQFQQAAIGDQVYPGTTLLRVVDLSGLVVAASLNQVDAQRVRLGQPAEIHFDAYPELALEGKVTAVGAIAGGGTSSFGSPGGGMQVKSIPVEIAFDAEDPRVIPDLSVAVDVTTSLTEHALVVPRTAVEQSEGKTFLRVREGESWVRRPVGTGESSAVETVILAGLDSGAQVAVENR